MPTLTKLIVSTCTGCNASPTVCAVVDFKPVCRGCDTSGTYVKLSSYKK